MFTWGESSYGQLGQGKEVVALNGKAVPGQVLLPPEVRAACKGSSRQRQAGRSGGCGWL